MSFKILSLFLLLNFVQFSESSVISFQNCIEESGISTEAVITQTSNSTLYNYLNHQWNIRVPTIYPAAYFLPRNTKDVQIGVKCGVKLNIPLIPKSGGHSYESYSFGGPDTIVMDFLNMSQILVDPLTRICVVGPGALLGEIYLKLWRSGNFGLPLGVYLSVGISGYTLGGGYGYPSSIVGLASDSVTEMEMVDANGEVVIANANTHPELFWALRGVGSGSIGIVTKFRFKMFDASKMKISYIHQAYDINQSAQILEAWQRWLNWTAQNSPGVNSGMQFGPLTDTNRQTAAAVGTFHFQDENLQPGGNETFLKAFHEIFPAPETSTTIYYQSYWDFILGTAYGPTTDTITEAVMENLRNLPSIQVYLRTESYYVSKSFEVNDLQKVGQAMQAMPTNSPVGVWIHSEGGAISTIAPDATSYIHRNALYSVAVNYEHMGPNVTHPGLESGLAWMSDFMKTTEFMDNKETYQNYVSRDRKDFLERYYGSNLGKLLEVKQQWDPNNYFQNPESLPVTAENASSGFKGNHFILLFTSFLFYYL